MNVVEETREEMWARQCLQCGEIDYSTWEQERAALQQMAKISRSCTFVVDVYKCRYTFASPNFADLLGYNSRKLATIGQYNDDYLESRIHPDDLAQMKSMQVGLSRFIYSQPEEERNNYKNIFTYRILNAKRQYIRVTGKHQVLKTSGSGKAWLILGVTDIASDQRDRDGIECTVVNLKNGAFFSPGCTAEDHPGLTDRETEVLQLVKQGLLSKEIACRLGISIHTVSIHRQNLLRKLGVQNSIEAINFGCKTGLFI